MSTGDLCTNADVEQFLSLTTNQDQALIAALITRASVFINSYANRNLMSASYVEKRHGRGNDAMMTRQCPITAVSSVVIDGQTVPASTGYGVSGYVFDEVSVYLRGYRFTRCEPLNVAISYTAGYAVVPGDLAQAAVEIVAAKYKRRTDLHVSSKVMDSQQITFNMSDVPPSAKTVLDNYSRAVWPE